MNFLSRPLLFILMTLIFSAPAWAGDHTVTTEGSQKKMQILRLFEAQAPRIAVDASIQSVADSRYAPGDPGRDEFISRMQIAVDYDAIEADSIAAMVEIYTLPELTAMADYYTSDLGRSAEGKGPAFREKIAPALKKMLDKGVLDVITSPSPAESAAGK